MQRTENPTQPSGSVNEARQKVDLLQRFIKSSIDDIGKKRKLNQKKATTVRC